MITLKIIFNLLAFTLFIIVFFKMIKKNDTTYIDILILQFIGIGVNFLELISDIKLPIIIKIILYILCIIIPGIVFILEKKNILFPELLNLIIAKYYLKQNNPEEAKRNILKLIDKYPNSYLGHKVLAEIYELEGKHTNAIDEYVRAIEINTKDYNSYYKISVLLQKLNNNEASIDMLNDLLRKKPDYLQASMLLGDILYNEERFKEATQVYTEALKYNPTNYDIYYNLGMAYTRLNDFQKAKEYYEIAAEINSMLYNAKFNLAQISMLYGDLGEAENYFMECLSKEDIEAGSYYYLAQISMLRGEKAKAINYINVAIELDSKIYKEIETQPIFLPIIKNIKTPNLNDTLSLKVQNKLTKKEKLTQKHLKETYYLINKLNNNDIKMIKNIKKSIENEKENQIEKDEK